MSGCHSSDSWNAHKGEELTEIKLKDDLRKFQRGITCVLFMGGDWDVLALNRLLLVVKDFGLKTALYSGADDVHSDLKSNLDYIKLGSYQKQLGGLESLETNQVLWHWPSQTKLNFYFTQHLQGEEMIRLNEVQLRNKLQYIQQYQGKQNAADSSPMDANANVTTKNVATLEAEIHKDINIQMNRHMVSQKIADLFGNELAQEYIRQIETHEIYVHDETSLKPYCVSISMYPFLLDGMTKLGGESKAPEHLSSFVDHS